MQEYPTDIYISRENPDTEDEYFSVQESAEEGAEIGTKKSVGHYVLKKTLTVEAKAVITVS